MRPIQSSVLDKVGSQIGLGCSRIGSFNNPTPIVETRKMLARALDLGVTLFDTADIYGQGDSERELGRLISATRAGEIQVVTKVGKHFSAKMRLLRPLKPLLKPLLPSLVGESIATRRDDNMGADFSPQRLVPAVERSLRRLNCDILDILLLHSPPAHMAGDPAVWDALAALKNAGKVRSYGVSCDDVAALRASIDMPGLSVLQLPPDVLEHAETSDLGARIREKGIAVLAREVIRMRSGGSPMDAVRGCLERGLATHVIVGTTRIEHLAEAVRAAEGDRIAQHA